MRDEPRNLVSTRKKEEKEKLLESGNYIGENKKKTALRKML